MLQLTGIPSASAASLPSTALLQQEQTNPFEYAFAMPLLSPLSGITAGVFNSCSPALDGLPVYNFLSIYNPGSQPFSADVEVYGQDGTLNTERSFRIAELAPAERRDFALGHEDGQVVGIYRIIPDDTAQQDRGVSQPLRPRSSRSIPLRLPALGLLRQLLPWSHSRLHYGPGDQLGRSSQPH